MKKLTLFLGITFCTILKAQQAPEILWSQFYGDYNKLMNCAIKDHSEGFIMVGESYDNDGWVNGWMIKISDDGDLIWEKTFEGPSDDNINSVALTNDGGYLVGANTHSTANNFDYWIIKMDSMGEVEWEKIIGDAGFNIVTDLISTSDGGFLITGYWNDDYHILKLNEGGEMEWEKFYGGSYDDYPFKAIEDQNGNFLITGYSNSSDGDVNSEQAPQNAWVISLNPDGDLNWSKTFGTESNDFLNNIKLLSNGDILLLGRAGAMYPTLPYAWAIKINANGDPLWEYTFGEGGFFNFFDAYEDENANLILLGNFHSDEITFDEHYGGIDTFLLKVDLAGNLIWSKVIGGLYNDEGKNLTVSDDRELYVLGTGGSNFWCLKFEAEEILAGTTENDGEKFQMFPNPVIDRLNFSDELVQIEIYNLAGELILKNAKSTSLNLQNLPKGTYFLKGKNANGKLIYQKFIKN